MAPIVRAITVPRDAHVVAPPTILAIGALTVGVGRALLATRGGIGWGRCVEGFVQIDHRGHHHNQENDADKNGDNRSVDVGHRYISCIVFCSEGLHYSQEYFLMDRYKGLGFVNVG